ncbi:MAG: hypothetical protein GQ559_00140 [Desulfobulbaceae bacterium]|nr:hypothetical protein [Desulfobulbaceae bacterium]
MPYTKFKQFKTASKECPGDVIPIGNVMRDAEAIFNLRTKSQLLEFIVNDGLEDLTYINKKPWEKNPDPEHEVIVYAFRFRTNAIPGYIAFMYQNRTDKWLIKSFHMPEDRDTPILKAFQKALLVKGENNDE